MTTSILKTFERQAALRCEADEIWYALARELESRIPDSMRRFAGELGWIQSELDGWWKLPEFLENLVANTQGGGGNSRMFSEDRLGDYGIKSFDELEAGLRDLELAWSGLVRIQIDKGEVYRWEVFFYASEVAPAPPVT